MTYTYLSLAEKKALLEERLRRKLAVAPIVSSSCSFSEELLWLIHQLNPNSNAYNQQMVVLLTGKLNFLALEQTLNALLDRHHPLRDTFRFESDKLVRYTQNTNLVLPVISVDELVKTDIMEEIENKTLEIITRCLEEPFDLENGPVFRAKLLRLNGLTHILLVELHHIVVDVQSFGVMIKEFSLFYNSFAKSEKPSLKNLPTEYKDIANKQRQKTSIKDLEKSLSYWENKLTSSTFNLSLPTDYQRPRNQNFIGARRTITIPDNIVESFSKFSRTYGVTTFAIMLTALKILLFKWTQQKDIVIGTVNANRTSSEVESLIGCFINFIPLRSIFSPEMLAIESLKQVRETIFESFANQNVPFQKIIERVNPTRKTNSNPLYNVGFLMQNFNLQIDGLYFAPISVSTLKQALHTDIKDAVLENGLKARFVPMDPEASLLDLRFIAAPISKLITCEYDRNLFNAETIDLLLANYCEILTQLLSSPEKPLSSFRLKGEIASEDKVSKKLKWSVSAPFSIANLEEVLDFWSNELGSLEKVSFLQSDKILSSLLITENYSAYQFNIILVRLEDLWNLSIEEFNKNKEIFFQSLKNIQSKTFLLVGLCPSSDKFKASTKGFEEEEKRLVGNLVDIGIPILNYQEIIESYSVSYLPDNLHQELGLVFSMEFFTALGTMLVRKVVAANRQPYKVIVIDCDGILWDGNCGEDEYKDLKIDFELQNFLVSQQKKGMLLCLSSKNNFEDVTNVFEKRVEMPLQLSHITALKINWESKSENIKSLVKELNIGLNSFIFVDNDPLECQEVKSNCPEILVIENKQDSDFKSRVKQLLCCWAFDQTYNTSTDDQRNYFYKQEAKRNLLYKHLTYKEFIDCLKLEINISALQENQISRASQLTWRTNQFNFTNKRRSESEIKNILQTNQFTVLAVKLKDSFGDYGIVGLLVFQLLPNLLNLDTFLLSCRALNRGVENKMLDKLLEIASQNNISSIEIPFTPSAKNQVAYNFLTSITEPKKNDAGDYVFSISSSIKIRNEPKKNNFFQASSTIKVAEISTITEEIQKITDHLSSLKQIIHAIDLSKIKTTKQSQRDLINPKTQNEKLLYEVWRKVLKIEKISIYDSFFDLGGNSLLSIVLLSAIHEEFSRRLSIETLIENPTIAQLASYLDTKTKEHTIEHTILEREKNLSIEEMPSIASKVTASTSEIPKTESIQNNNKKSRLSLNLENEYVIPQTDTEKALEAIWSDVFEIENLGAEDNIFDLGGNSLSATQILARIRDQFSVELSLRIVFEAPTISTMALEIENQK